MTISSGDLLRFAVVWKLNGSDEQTNVWHTGVLNPAPVQADFEDDVKEYFEQMYASPAGGWPTALIHDRIEVYNVTNGQPESWIGADATLNGQSGGQMLPESASGLVYARTAYSRVIGKKYLPVFTENVWDGTGWGAGANAALASVALKWAAPYSSVNGTGFRSGVYSAGHGFLYPISVAYSARPAYQRRRKLGRGS